MDFFNNKIRSEANRIEAVKAGGVEIIMDVIRIHTNNDKTCLYGSGALVKMIINNSKNGTHNYFYFILKTRGCSNESNRIRLY